MTNINEIAIASAEVNDFVEVKDPIKAAAISILKLEDELSALEQIVKAKKAALNLAMEAAMVKKIVFQNGQYISRIVKKNLKVDKEKALIFLDSKGITEDFMELSDKKLKEVYYDPKSNSKYDFFYEDKPTSYVQLGKG